MAAEIVSLNQKHSPMLKYFLKILFCLLPIWGIIFNLSLEYYFGLQIYTGVYYAVFVGLGMFVIFLQYPEASEGKVVRWHDVVLALAAVIPCINFAWKYEEIALTGGVTGSTLDFALGIIFILAILEATRRTTGIFMVLVAVFFIIHGLYADMFPTVLRGPSIELEDFVITSYLASSGIFGMIMHAVSTYLIAFATFGAFMVALGAGDKFVDLAMAFIGKVRGGAAKVSTVASAAMGTLTGCPIGNVGISGSFTIPLMKRTGFSPEMAAAIETTASVGGVIMPPMMGAIIFIMVEITGWPYVEIIKIALFPAILYFMALYFQIDFYSKRHNMKGLAESELPNKKESLNKAKYLIVIFLLLIYFLVGLYLFPVRAAYYAMFIMIGLFVIDKYTTVTWDRIVEGLERSTKNALPVIPIACAAGIIMASINLTGTGIRLSNNLVQVAGDSLIGLVIMLGVACYILGLGISAMLAYILLSTLVAPALVELGVPMIAAHFFIIYMGLSGFFTPPYAVVALAASAVGGSKFYSTSFKSMRLAVVAYLVPITLILDPVLLLQDVDLVRLITRIVVSVISIYLLSGSLEGYFYDRVLSIWERTALFVGSILLFIPFDEFLYVGSAVILVFALLFIWNSRRISKTAEVQA